MPVYRDRARDTWYAKFYYTNSQGEKCQKFKRGFATKEDATRYEHEFHSYNLGGGDQIFRNVYAEYILDMEHKLKKSTIYAKKNIFENKILPYFADKRLETIQVPDIKRWQISLLNDEKNYSKTYIQNVNAALATFMSYADRIYGLPMNPCIRAGGIPSEPRGEVEFWTLDEYKRFISKFDPNEDALAYTAFEVLYWTGMRSGELLALTAEDIDLKNAEIDINKTYTRIDGEDYIRSPKTASSVRRVQIPDFLVDELEDYMHIYRAKPIKEASPIHRLFPVHRTTIAYHLRKNALLAGVHPIRLHGLRHSHVALLINEGVEPIDISRRLGHSRTSITLDVYGHLFPARQAAIIKRLDQLGKMPRNPMNYSIADS